MTPSPLFLDEMSTQVVRAQDQLTRALRDGDERGAAVAADRLAELERILAMVSDVRLDTVPTLI